MGRFFWTAMIALATQALLAGQGGIRAFGGPPDEDRASARVVYFDSDSQAFVGQMEISYGRPRWNSLYDDAEKFDSLTKGRVIRLGKNFWTRLDTTVPLVLSGRRINAGLYYLGLERAGDGAWRLAFFLPERVRSKHVDASRTQDLVPDFTAPLHLSANALRKDRLQVSFSYSQSRPTQVRLTVEWGPYLLESPVEVILDDGAGK